MIELQLTIDPTKEPVTGQVAARADGHPTAFVGYVELISVLQRVLVGAGAHPAAGCAYEDNR